MAGFWAVTLLLIVAPGADWAFTLSSSLRGHGVVPAVGGLAAGYALMTAVVAAGVGVLVAGSSGALTAVSLLGGAYLVWLGVGTLRHPSAPPTAAEAADAARPAWATFAAGIGVSGLNPKGLLVFMALLPQFTDRGAAWPVPVQMGLLGVVFTATCWTFYSALGLFARTVLRARPSAARTLSRVSGVGMVLIGAALVVERLLSSR